VIEKIVVQVILHSPLSVGVLGPIHLAVPRDHLLRCHRKTGSDVARLYLWHACFGQHGRSLAEKCGCVRRATQALRQSVITLTSEVALDNRRHQPALLKGLIRWVVNAFRGIDTVVFALLFVAAVGLGPFAGVLGMIVHSMGVIAKLNAEAIETLPSAPLEAAALSGANRTKIVTYAMLPAVLPNLASVSLYVWEANVRTSTILGIVGAGGIGIEIKAAIDLLDFPKLFTLSVIVLIMVTAIDQFSAWLRRRLV